MQTTGELTIRHRPVPLNWDTQQSFRIGTAILEADFPATLKGKDLLEKGGFLSKILTCGDPWQHEAIPKIYIAVLTDVPLDRQFNNAMRAALSMPSEKTQGAYGTSVHRIPDAGEMKPFWNSLIDSLDPMMTRIASWDCGAATYGAILAGPLMPSEASVFLKLPLLT